MNRVIAISAGAVAVAALATACGSTGNNVSSSSQPPASSAPAASGAAVHTASSKYGTILVDGSGHTLYMLTADTGGKSTCSGTCAVVWPPEHTSGMPSNSGVTASMVATTTRADHTTQVTYNGHPLYTFVKDTAPGVVNGEGITNFGGTWYVVGVDGNAIMAAPAAPSSPSPSPSTSGGGYGY
ncbi:COG4315 family predicted lipoprotein [Streptacidiphilus rugosus]|uniref:COG4315 family predicted lipoprotein n=1 Tax=Streptacidiphilus rugosus TaxID=405783 RepID=UPI00056411E7|nr:hypothetical protein [Streptacidiphilus rugosus]